MIYIYSNNGNIVFSEAKNISGEGTVTINVQDLETGNYSLDIILNNSSDAGENVEIEVKDGYLIFSSDSVFKRTIEAIQSQEDDPSETRASSCLNNELPNVEGFKSIASLQKELARQSTRSSGSEYESDADDEEMSLDEYNAMKAEDLLIDPSLTEVMDTTLR